MGHRSEVYIKIDATKAIEFMFILKANEITWIEPRVSTDKNYVLFFGSDLKWYSSYKEVNAVNTFIDETDNCTLIAVGEDERTEIYGDTHETGLQAYTVIEGFDE